MKSAYPIKIVSDVLTLEYGKPLPESDRTSDEGVPAYGANGLLCWSRKAFRTKPSIIVGRKGSAGEIKLTEGPFWPTDVTYYVEHNEHETDLRYLFHLLKSLGLPKLAKGVKPGINRNDVYALQVPIPLLSEQKRIVAILDEAFEKIGTLIANTEKNLANVCELLNRYLNSAFALQGAGWVARPLGECFRLKSGDGLTSKDMVNGPFPVFGGNGVAGMHNKFNLSGDNVIVGRVGALCGNARLITEKIWLTDNAFKVVDCSNVFDCSFLAFLLNYLDLRTMARQSAQPVISNSSLMNLSLVFPESIVQQHQIATNIQSVFSETQRLKGIYRQKLSSLNELKQAILQKAFTGGLNEHFTNAVQGAAA